MNTPNLSVIGLATNVFTYVLNPGEEEQGATFTQQQHNLRPVNTQPAATPQAPRQSAFDIENPATNTGVSTTQALDRRAQSSYTHTSNRWNISAGINSTLSGLYKGAKFLTREVTAAALFATIVGGSAAASGALGNVVVGAAHDGYDVSRGTFASLTGSAVFGGAFYLALRALVACSPQQQLAGNRSDVGVDILGQMTIAAVGNAILQDAGVSTLSTRNAAVAAGAGAAILDVGLGIVSVALRPVLTRMNNQNY